MSSSCVSLATADWGLSRALGVSVAGSKENMTAGYDPRLNPEQRGVDHVLKGTALVRKKKRKEKERKEKMIDYKDFHT